MGPLGEEAGETGHRGGVSVAVQEEEGPGAVLDGDRAAGERLQWRHHREANRRLAADAGVSVVQWDVLRHLHDRPGATLHSPAELTFQTGSQIVDEVLAESVGTLTAAERVVLHGLPGKAPGHPS